MGPGPSLTAFNRYRHSETTDNTSGKALRHRRTWRWLRCWTRRLTSGDWEALINSRSKQAAAMWSGNNQLRLLVNAWVQRLKVGKPQQTSVDLVTQMFIDAHANGDTSVLLSDNFVSYQHLIRNASDNVLRKFLERATHMMGTPELKLINSRFSGGEQFKILSDALSRGLRSLLRSREPLGEIQTNLRMMATYSSDTDFVSRSRDQEIWFSAVAQTAGLKDITVRRIDYSRIFSFLIERAKADPASRDGGLCTDRSDCTSLYYFEQKLPELQIHQK